MLLLAATNWASELELSEFVIIRLDLSLNQYITS